MQLMKAQLCKGESSSTHELILPERTEQPFLIFQEE